MKRLALMVLLLLPLLGVAQLIEVGRFEGVASQTWPREVNYSGKSFFTTENIASDTIIVRCYIRGERQWRKVFTHRFSDTSDNDFQLLGNSILVRNKWGDGAVQEVYDSIGLLRTTNYSGQLYYYNFAYGNTLVNSHYDNDTRIRTTLVTAFDEGQSFDLRNDEGGILEGYDYRSNRYARVRLNDVAFFYERDGMECKLWSIAAWDAPVEFMSCAQLYDSYNGKIVGQLGSSAFISDGSIEGTEYVKFNDSTILGGAGPWIIYKIKTSGITTDWQLKAYNMITSEGFTLVPSKLKSTLPSEVFADEARERQFYYCESSLLWTEGHSKMDIYRWDLNTPNEAVQIESDNYLRIAQANNGIYGIESSDNLVSLYKYKNSSEPYISSFGLKGLPRIVDYYGSERSTLYITTSKGRIYELDQVVGSDAPLMTSLSIYPNPAANQVRVESPKIIHSFSIHSLSGKELLRMQNVNSQLADIDLSSFQKGIYLVKVEGAEYRSTERLLIE